MMLRLTQNLLVMATILLVTLLSSCSSSPDPSLISDKPLSASAPITQPSAVTQKLYQLTSEYRRKHGRSQLTKHPLLVTLSLEHSRFLARENARGVGLRSICHKHFDTRNRFSENKIRYSLSENVVWTSENPELDPAEEMFRLLINSPSHRKALNSKISSIMGFAVVKSNGRYYATQLFGRKAPARMQQSPFVFSM